MRFGGFGGKLAVAGVMLMAVTPFGTRSADARPRPSAGAVHANVRAIYAGISAARSYGYSQHAYGYSRRGRSFGYSGYTSGYSSGGYLQCVPFARENTGIELSGNAATWWAAAQGVYERGAKPEVGSVLNFRANGRMHMGHVAVVSGIVNARTVSIDHANWSGHGSVSHDTTVVDVSSNNDWTAVRVSLGGDQFGSIYPTYGFIYDRPDHGTMVANNTAAPAPVLNPAPRDLRPAVARMTITTAPQEAEEVAEAADDSDGVQPRFTRVGRHLVRVQSHGHAVVRSFGPRSAHVLRIRVPTVYGPTARAITFSPVPRATGFSPAPRATAHRHGRA